MSLEERLLDDMKLAMKAGDRIKLSTIRMLRSQTKDAKINKKSDLDENEVEQILVKAAKARNEAIEMYSKGNREDLVLKEKQELEIISAYLPEQLSNDEIVKIIHETITDLNVQDEKDMGRVMGSVMPKVKGKADGKLVQQKVREILSALPK